MNCSELLPKLAAHHVKAHQLMTLQQQELINIGVPLGEAKQFMQEQEKNRKSTLKRVLGAMNSLDLLDTLYKGSIRADELSTLQTDELSKIGLSLIHI